MTGEGRTGRRLSAVAWPNADTSGGGCWSGDLLAVTVENRVRRATDDVWNGMRLQAGGRRNAMFSMLSVHPNASTLIEALAVEPVAAHFLSSPSMSK